MKKKIKKLLRKFVITEDEEYLMAFYKIFLNPDKYFYGYRRFDLVESSICGFTMDERFSLSDIYVKSNNYNFAYIQNIQIDLKNKKVIVGHIAIDSQLVGMGFGKRIIFAFGRFITKNYDIQKIHFCETSQNNIYPYFFVKKLGATIEKNEGCTTWLWEIPKKS